MIGYHQTSLENWLRIQKEGLQLYEIKRHGKLLKEVGFSLPVMAIWIWKEQLDLVSLHMNVLWHMREHSTKRVVSLSVQYTEGDLLRLERSAVNVTHWLDMEGIRFYENSQATLLARPVPIERLKLLRQFNWSRYLSPI